jgi:serine/threonine protein kinase
MHVVRDTGSGPVTKPLRRLGKYELISRIAAGGMAEVYLARLRGPMNFQKAVVVKVIHPHLATQDEFLRMLLDEARLSALIKHPRVVDIYELGCEQGVYFIAMEFIAGQPLSAVMGAGIEGQPLDPLSTARIIADAADGLHAAHELKGASGNTLGLVHRDVSPGNIMVLHDGGVKIVDFGIAKARGRLTISGVQQFKGKVGYVAPEQLSGGLVDRRTDVFSLGVVMWEALALDRLYRMEDERECLRTILDREAPTPTSVRPEVPHELSAICLKALSPFADYRFQTAGEMRDAIESYLIRVGYYREAGAIRSYMDRVFGRQHESRQRTVRKMAHATTSGEMPFAVDITFDSEDEDYPELLIAPEPQAAALADLARGTPVEKTPEPRVREAAATVPLTPVRENRRTPRASDGEVVLLQKVKRAPAKGRGLVVMFLLVAIAAAVAAIIVLRDGQKGAEQTPPVTSARTDTPVPARPAVAPPAEPPAAPAETPPVVEETAGDASEPRRAPAAKAKGKEPEKEKKSAAQLYEEGADLFVQGKASQAKDRFKQALAADSRHAPAHRGLGLAYSAEGKRDKAKKAFKRYLQLRPGASDADAIRKRIEQLE